MANSAFLSGLPEFSDIGEFSPGLSWDERTRGGGVGPTRHRPVVVIAEQNLLCYENDVFPHEDIFVHEFAHGLLNMGVEQQPGGTEFRRRLETAYKDALDAGLWVGIYAGENADEYWAEGVQSWYDLNDPPGPIHNEINTRAELKAYDPALAALLEEVFGESTVTASCHETVDIPVFPYSIQGVVFGPEGEPLKGIGLWAWQGEKENNAYGETDTDGTFDIRVPNGEFTLDMYAGPGCSFVGWYDGAGITSSRSEAVRITVDGDGVEGIEIKLPGQPDQLPRIEWCS